MVTLKFSDTNEIFRGCEWPNSIYKLSIRQSNKSTRSRVNVGDFINVRMDVKVLANKGSSCLSYPNGVMKINHKIHDGYFDVNNQLTDHNQEPPYVSNTEGNASA